MPLAVGKHLNKGTELKYYYFDLRKRTGDFGGFSCHNVFISPEVFTIINVQATDINHP
jgi:hypothetical protein